MVLKHHLLLSSNLFSTLDEFREVSAAAWFKKIVSLLEMPYSFFKICRLYSYLLIEDVSLILRQKVKK